MIIESGSIDKRLLGNIFYGYAPLMSGLFLLNLDSSDTHVHSIEAKR